MGLDWGRVASGALGTIGDNINVDRERARSRRQGIIDASVQDMFTSGKEAFSKRQLEREGIQENIEYFKSMGFDRGTIEQLVALSPTEIDKLKLRVDDGQKFASLEDKPFDAYGSINVTDPSKDVLTSKLSSAKISVNNMPEADRIETLNSISKEERTRLIDKAYKLGIPTNAVTEEQKRNLGIDAILQVYQLEASKTNYEDWEDSVLDNIMGKIDPEKFKDNREEKSFGDNFRTSLRDNFGWAGGEQEEALRQAALLFPGKSAAELRAVLDPTLYERDKSIEPLEYRLGYTALEERQFKTAAVTLEKATLEFNILTEAKAQNDQPMSALRLELNNPKFGTIDGELVGDDLTVGRYEELKKLEIDDLTAQSTRKRLDRAGEDTSATASRNIKDTYGALQSIAGTDSSKLDPTVYDSISWLKDPEYPEITAKDIATQANFNVNKNFSNMDPYAKTIIRDNMARDMFIAKVYMDIMLHTNENKLNDVLDNLDNRDTVKSLVGKDEVAAFVIGLPAITKDAIKNNKDALGAMLTDSTDSDYHIPITESYVDNITDEKIDHNIYEVAYRATEDEITGGKWAAVLTPNIMNELFSDEGTLDIGKFGSMFGPNGTYGEDLITPNNIDVSKLAAAKLTRDTLLAALNSGEYLMPEIRK